MSDQRKLLQLGTETGLFRDRLANSFDVTFATTKEELTSVLANGAGIEAIAMMGHWDMNAATFDKLPDLKIISNFGVGYDPIDADEAARRGILVSHTPNVLNEEVADTAIMLWLAVSREMIPADRWARSGDWEAKGPYPLTRSVRGRTVGIVGMGRIGRSIAALAGIFEATVLYNSRSEKPVPYMYRADLVQMAKECDVLIVITPGGAGTKHLINAEVINALGPDGILINVARGSVVDEAALVAALEEGRLGAAGLDVFEDEPRIPDALKAMDNVVLQPHVGSASVETRQAMADLVCDNLDHWREFGRVLTPVPECKSLNENTDA